MTLLQRIEARELITVTYWLHQWNNVGDGNTGCCVEYGEESWPSWSILIIYT